MTSNKTITKYRGFLHGGDYNPEQWLKYPEILKQDIEYMKKAHCNTVTLGIFSWAFLEPEEDKYNFEYLEEIVKNLTDNGIKIILSTPSGARPRWMAKKYPEVLRVDKNGCKKHYGERHNHCPSSPVYRQKTVEIDKMLAQKFKDNPNIILWHISNEFGGECYCDLCQSNFRRWLKNKYKTLDNLNHAWWTGFWSCSVTDWDQIEPPMNNGEPDYVLPGLSLDWREFATYQATDFMKCEIEAVRTVTPDIPVTTNFIDIGQGYDYRIMQEPIDVISWDSYPQWHISEGNDITAYRSAFSHDLQRGFKGKPYLIMENTPSLTNWFDICRLKRPGMHMLSSMQAVAHGSESVLYFQWRKGRGGCEKFHGAVVDHDNSTESRVFKDVTEVGKNLEKLAAVLGTNVVSQVALIYDYKTKWALEVCQGFQNADKAYEETCMNHYKEFWKRGINVDVVGANADLSKYNLVVMPMLYCISDEEITNIKNYAANGGTVVGTYMTGYADKTDLCYMGGFPGEELKDVFGLVNNEIDTLGKDDRNAVVMNGREYTAVDYCELVTPTTAEVKAEYSSDFYAGKPAVLRNRYGSGKSWYVSCRDTGGLINDLYEEIIKDANIKSRSLPKGVTVHTRTEEDRGDVFYFVENYNETSEKVFLGGNYTDVLTGEKVTDIINTDGYGIRILKGDVHGDI